MAELSPQLAELVARRFAVLGDPTRLRLLNLMHERGEASVGELVAASGGSQANISKHLGVLLAERLVQRRRDGSRAIYSIADPTLAALCDEVCDGMRALLRDLHAIADQGVGAAP